MHQKDVNTVITGRSSKECKEITKTGIGSDIWVDNNKAMITQLGNQSRFLAEYYLGKKPLYGELVKMRLATRNLPTRLQSIVQKIGDECKIQD